MGHNLKLSVIIPVYNTAQYLDSLFNSVITQTYKNMEIIFVDDGSSDDSPKILKDFANRDSRVKVITKPNGGSSSSRNAGLAACSGQYITFIDGDDMFCSDEAYSTLMDLIVKNDCDILKFSLTRLNTDGSISHRVKMKHASGVYEGEQKDKLFKAIILNDGIDNSASNCIFKKEFLDNNSILFNKQGINHGEDLLFMMLSMPKAKRVFLSADTHFYGYRQNPFSLGNNYDSSYAAHTRVLTAKLLEQASALSPKEDFYRVCCTRIINLAFYVLFMEASPVNKRSFCQKAEYINNFFADNIIKDALKNADFDNTEFGKALPVKLALKGFGGAALALLKAERFAYVLKGRLKV